MIEGGSVPLRHRRYDLILVAFFVVNAAVITYVIDLEQLVVADPAWLLLPLAVIWRMRHDRPFSRLAARGTPDVPLDKENR
jgi:hypothetical protein